MGALANKNYDSTLHRIARAMYEIEGKTLQDVGKELGITEATIMRWKMKEKWDGKGSGLDKVSYLTRQNFIEKMSKLGMPEEKAMKVLIDGMTNPNNEEVIGVDGEGKPITRDVPDYNTIHKYMKDYFKMASMMDTPGKDSNSFTAGEGGTLNVQVNMPPLKLDDD